METTVKALAALAALVALGALGAQLAGQPLAWVGVPLAALIACAAVIVYDPRRGAFATAVVCAVANAYLLQAKCAATGQSVCNVNSVVNCDVVNSSAASMMFGLPITLFGVGFYVGLAIAAAFAGPTPREPGRMEDARFDQVNAAFAIFNLAYSAWLAYQSSLLGAVCIVCISIYAGNALLLWSAVAALRRQAVGPLEAPGGIPTSAPFAVIAAVFAAFLLMGGPAWRQCEVKLDLTALVAPNPAPLEAPAPGKAPVPDALDVSALYHLPRGTVTTTGQEPRRGSTDPKYILLEFADFGCPHCALASRDLDEMVLREKDLQIRFRVFPLTGACNPAIPQDAGPERCFAAMSAWCAGQQGKYFEMSHLLFANQPAFAPADLTIMAEQVGLDMPRWGECMQDPAASTAIQTDALAGAQAAIHGTPSFFLLGTHGEQFIEVPRLEVVPQLLAAHRAGTPLPPPPPAPPDEH